MAKRPLEALWASKRLAGRMRTFYGATKIYGGFSLSGLQPLIPRKLAVGPKPSSLNSLKTEGITAIVDLNQDSREMHSAREIGLKYSVDPKLRIEDNYEPIPVDVLEYVTKTIDRLISEGHYVYLHCTASIGRSPTIAAAYLIYLGKTRKEATDEVKGVRPTAWRGPDGNYAAYLDEFARESVAPNNTFYSKIQSASDSFFQQFGTKMF